MELFTNEYLIKIVNYAWGNLGNRVEVYFNKEYGKLSLIKLY
jgi:hypothetical protein